MGEDRHFRPKMKNLRFVIIVLVRKVVSTFALKLVKLLTNECSRNEFFCSARETSADESLPLAIFGLISAPKPVKPLILSKWF